MGLYENIRDIAKSRGYSINRLEQELGFARSSINKFNRNTPSVDKLQQIANKLGVTVDDLVNEPGLTTCKECGLMYDSSYAPDVKTHYQRHATKQEAEEKFGELYNYYPERERIKAENRAISDNISLPLKERYQAQLKVLKCLYSRSVQASGYNLNHVTFDVYIAMMLANTSYTKNLDKKLYEALVKEYGTSSGIDSGTYYKIPTSQNTKTQIQKNHRNTEQNSVTFEEFEHLIKPYRQLDDYGRETVDLILERETQRITDINALKSQTSENISNIIGIEEAAEKKYYITYYQKLASAGSGEYLFTDIPTQLITVADTPIARKADFVIGVNGDSMEPDFQDGDQVFVQKMAEIPTGSIGIFVRGNECFIKELGSDRLISHNKKYADIPASEDIRCVGLVLGKV